MSISRKELIRRFMAGRLKEGGLYNAAGHFYVVQGQALLDHERQGFVAGKFNLDGRDRLLVNRACYYGRDFLVAAMAAGAQPVAIYFGGSADFLFRSSPSPCEDFKRFLGGMLRLGSYHSEPLSAKEIAMAMAQIVGQSWHDELWRQVADGFAMERLRSKFNELRRTLLYSPGYDGPGGLFSNIPSTRNNGAWRTAVSLRELCRELELPMEHFSEETRGWQCKLDALKQELASQYDQTNLVRWLARWPEWTNDPEAVATHIYYIVKFAAGGSLDRDTYRAVLLREPRWLQVLWAWVAIESLRRALERKYTPISENSFELALAWKRATAELRARGFIALPDVYPDLNGCASYIPRLPSPRAKIRWLAWPYWCNPDSQHWQDVGQVYPELAPTLKELHELLAAAERPVANFVEYLLQSDGRLEVGE